MKINKKSLLIVLVASFIGGLVSVAIFAAINKNETELVHRYQDDTQFQFVSNKVDDLPNFTVAAEKTGHAVVHVPTIYKQETTNNNNQRRGGSGQGDIFDWFFGDDDLFEFRSPRGNFGQRMPQEASGSGVIISADGYIVTNNHVIEKSTEIKVTLNDKRSYTATLVGADPSTDIALIKIDEKDLTFLEFGNSDNLLIGEWVLAVGNPFNLTSTVTAGIVSAKARSINLLAGRNGEKYAIESFIQTDAAVNPGNSGGALVNLRGNLVGINTAIASNTGSYSGYSFAVPSTIVKKVVNDIKKFGKVKRGIMGVSIQNIDSKLAKELKLDKIEGVHIADITEGGAAKKAGIRKGDIVLEIENKKVNSPSELQEQISKFRPDDKIKIKIKRKNDIKELFVTLQDKDKFEANDQIARASIPKLGAEFGKITKKEKENLRISHGVKIEKLENNSILKKHGIKDGFIILFVNQKSVNSIEDIQNALKTRKGSGVMFEGVYPNGTRSYYGFGMD